MQKPIEYNQMPALHAACAEANAAADEGAGRTIEFAFWDAESSLSYFEAFGIGIISKLVEPLGWSSIVSVTTVAVEMKAALWNGETGTRSEMSSLLTCAKRKG